MVGASTSPTEGGMSSACMREMTKVQSALAANNLHLDEACTVSFLLTGAHQLEITDEQRVERHSTDQCSTMASSELPRVRSIDLAIHLPLQVRTV